MNEAPRKNTSATVVMAGLPKTGKTTFLGALYHVLESGGSDAIALQSMPDMRRHLEAARQRWLKVEAESRTPISSVIMNEMRLSLDSGRASIDLRWPDLSGEHFRDMVTKRILNNDVDAILEEASAMLFFIHPDTVTKSPRIGEVNHMAAQLHADQDADEEQAVEADIEEVKLENWDPSLVPGEVMTVELLQRIVFSDYQQKVNKVAIVLSAWDKLSPYVDSPDAYLAREMPMLNQFIDANSDLVDLRTYGVSALGGDPETDKARLLAEVEPTLRIGVVNNNGEPTSAGILSPIQWLIG